MPLRLARKIGENQETFHSLIAQIKRLISGASTVFDTVNFG